MERKGMGCGLWGVIMFVLIAGLISSTIGIGAKRTILSYGAAARADVLKVSDTIMYPGADTVKVSYSVDGKTYKSAVMAQKDSVSEGDVITIGYLPKSPRMITTEADLGFRERERRVYLIVAGVWIVLGLLFRILSGLKGRSGSAGSFSERFAAYDDPSEQRFWDLFDESIRYKNAAMLSSALRSRERGLELMEDRSDYYCMAHHNLQVLRCFHCCEGVQAYKDGVESLKYKDEYRELSDRMKPRLTYSSYDESLTYTAMLAKNREEAKALLEEVKARNANRTAVKHAGEMLGMMDKFPRWVDYQKNYAANFYSRHSAKADRGDYSPACALLQLILTREGQKGYDLTEEEYVNLLDDYLMVSLKYFTLRSNVLLQHGGAPDSELLFIVKNPLKMLVEFLPDCEEKRFKDVFKSVMKEYAVYDQPLRLYVPEYEEALKVLGI